MDKKYKDADPRLLSNWHVYLKRMGKNFTCYCPQVPNVNWMLFKDKIIVIIGQHAPVPIFCELVGIKVYINEKTIKLSF